MLSKGGAGLHGAPAPGNSPPPEREANQQGLAQTRNRGEQNTSNQESGHDTQSHKKRPPMQSNGATGRQMRGRGSPRATRREHDTRGEQATDVLTQNTLRALVVVVLVSDFGLSRIFRETTREAIRRDTP